jgi:hypothetical protein
LRRFRINSLAFGELERSSRANRESPGTPEDKEETRKKYGQTGDLGPNFDGPANKVREPLADQDENHVKQDQFHGGVPQTPLRWGQGMSSEKMV